MNTEKWQLGINGFYKLILNTNYLLLLESSADIWAFNSL